MGLESTQWEELLKKWKQEKNIEQNLFKSYKIELNKLLVFAESEPEKMLLTELWILVHKRAVIDAKKKKIMFNDFGKRITGKKTSSSNYAGILDLEIELQKELKTKENTYRADFFVSLVRNHPNGSKIEICGLLVEVDGFKYHNTETSMIVDRKRDRDIFYEYGYNTLRFLAEELSDNSKDISWEVINHIDRLGIEVFKNIFSF